MMEHTLTGGTRQQGQSPQKVAGLPVVTVITVVYNGRSLIEKTISSIIGQTYPNIEFIVIDGKSPDGTVEIIRQYEKHISYWISESDSGIYDAMNKGLAQATGDYVWFINAGDLIYSADTLEKVFPAGEPGTQENQEFPHVAKVYYGEAMVVDSGYREIGLRRLRPPEVLSWKSFKNGMLVCHQAIIVNREIAEPFDPQYRHSADFDWVVRAVKKAEGVRAEGIRAGRQEGKWGGKGKRIKGSEELGDKAGVQDGGRQEGRLITHPGLLAADAGLGQVVKAGGGSSLSQGFSQVTAGIYRVQSVVNTRLILCAFLDGGHSKKNIGISLWERFHSMVRHYGFLPTLLRHILIAMRFGWYYLRNRRF